MIQVDLFWEVNIRQTNHNQKRKFLILVSFLKKKNCHTKISSIVTKTELTIVQNIIPSINNLVTKTDFNTKVTEIEGKFPDTANLATELH